jgi:outer membrane protein TolC
MHKNSLPMKIIKIIVSGFLLILQISANAQQWSLDSCLQYARGHNKELLAQGQAVQAASRGREISRSALYPEISGKAEINHYWSIPVQAFPAQLIGGEPGTFIPVQISTPWTASYGVDASVKLIDPQAWKAVKLSSLQLQMQENDLHSLEQLLLKQVRMAYHNTVNEKNNYDAVQQLYESYKEIHKLIALQFEKGLIHQIAYNQSQSLHNDRQEAKSQASVGLRSAYLDLKFWMGYPIGDSLSITEKTNIPYPQARSFSAHRLPGYKGQRLRQALAEEQWKNARSGNLPSLSAMAGFQRIAFRNSFDFLSGGDWFNVGSVGFRLNIPILSLRQMIYEPSRQKALWKQANYQFERYQEEQETNYQKEKMQLQHAYQVWQNQKENLRLAQQNEALTIRKIENGIIDMLELKQVQDNLYQVQQRVSRARLDYLRHAVELDYLQKELPVE